MRTPSGSPPTGSAARISPVAISTTDASPASSLATYRRVPSALTATCSGSVPARTMPAISPVAISTMPMPSAARSGGGRVLSSVPGGEGGEPLRAMNSRAPSGDTLMPRGRLPSGMVATTSCVPPAITVMSPEYSLVTYTWYGGGGAGGTASTCSGGGASPPAQAASAAAASTGASNRSAIPFTARRLSVPSPMGEPRSDR